MPSRPRGDVPLDTPPLQKLPSTPNSDPGAEPRDCTPAKDWPHADHSETVPAQARGRNGPRGRGDRTGAHGAGRAHPRGAARPVRARGRGRQARQGHPLPAAVPRVQARRHRRDRETRGTHEGALRPAERRALADSRKDFARRPLAAGGSQGGAGGEPGPGALHRGGRARRGGGGGRPRRPQGVYPVRPGAGGAAARRRRAQRLRAGHQGRPGRPGAVPDARQLLRVRPERPGGGEARARSASGGAAVRRRGVPGPREFRDHQRAARPGDPRCPQGARTRPGQPRGDDALGGLLPAPPQAGAGARVPGDRAGQVPD